MSFTQVYLHCWYVFLKWKKGCKLLGKRCLARFATFSRSIIASKSRKMCKMNFWQAKAPPPPLGNFPKSHPFWESLSLRWENVEMACIRLWASLAFSDMCHINQNMVGCGMWMKGIPLKSMNIRKLVLRIVKEEQSICRLLYWASWGLRWLGGLKQFGTVTQEARDPNIHLPPTPSLM